MATRTMHSKHVTPARPRTAWLSAGLAVIVLGGGIATWMLVDASQSNGEPAEILVAQMQAAAKGENPPAFHALGGSLRTAYTNGRIAVIANDIPAAPCVKAGWRLSKLGTIIVNGTLSSKLSAAKLSELCEGGATLMWLPN